MDDIISILLMYLTCVLCGYSLGILNERRKYQSPSSMALDAGDKLKVALVEIAGLKLQLKIMEQKMMKYNK